MVTFRSNRIVLLFIGLLFSAVVYSQSILIGVIASGMPSSTLLFKSGFEDDVVYVPWSEPNPGQADYEDIEGSDEVGYTWPIQLRSPTTSRFHHIIDGTGDPVDDLNDFFTTDIVTVTGHGGGSTKALYQSLDSLPNAISQTWYEIYYASPTSITDEDTYIKYWMKLPSHSIDTMGASRWRSVFFMKSVDVDYRIEAYIYTTSTNVPYWFVHGDKFDGGYEEFWSESSLDADTSNVEVPIDEWFTMEYFWHRTNDENGRFYWAVNGDTVCDRYGSLYGPSNNNITLISPFGVYANEVPAHQWIDDLEIWNGFPPE